MADINTDYFNPLLREVIGERNLNDIRSFEIAITQNNWKEVEAKLKKEDLNKAIKDYYQGLMELHKLEKLEEELKAQPKEKPATVKKKAKKETSLLEKAAELVSGIAGQFKETATQAGKAVGLVAEEQPIYEQIRLKSTNIADKLEAEDADKDAVIKKYLRARLYSRAFFSDITGVDNVFRLMTGSPGYSRSRANEAGDLIKEVEDKAWFFNRWRYRLSQAWKAFIERLFGSSTLVRESKSDVAPKPKDAQAVAAKLQADANNRKFKTSATFRERNNAAPTTTNSTEAGNAHEPAVVAERRDLTAEEQAIYAEQFSRKAKIKSADALPLIEKVKRQVVISMRNTLMEHHNQLKKKKEADILAPITDLMSKDDAEIRNTYTIEGKANVFENIDAYADKFAQTNDESLAAIQDEAVKEKALNMARIIRSLNAILANEDKQGRHISPKTLAEFKTLLASPHIKQLDEELKDLVKEVAADLAKLENPVTPAVSPALSHPATAEPVEPLSADKTVEQVHTPGKSANIEAVKLEEVVVKKEPVDEKVVNLAKNLEKDLGILLEYVKDHHKDILKAKKENFTALMSDLDKLLKKESIKSNELKDLLEDHLKKDNNVEDKIAKTSVRGVLLSCLSELMAAAPSAEITTPKP